MADANQISTIQGLEHLPQGLFVVSGAYEGRRAGLVVQWVCRCANQPPLVGVALAKGHWVSPIIRDSHHFGLSLVLPSEKLVVRKFSEPLGTRESDPFDCMATERLTSAAPLLSKSPLLLDCEVVRHLDLEADTEMFIGRVIASRCTI
jgi:flavin reductase (DIM6/NTAB) family NADH-FMN oxidoreductase RutF